VLTLLALVALPPAHAVFSDTTGNAANLLAADRLAPPSGLTATQTCSYASITFRANTTASGTDSLTLAAPAGTVANDVLLAQVVHAYTTTVVLTPPSGWTLIRRDHSSTVLTSALYRRTAVTGEPSATFTFPANSGIAMAGGVAAYSGVSTTSPVDASAAAEGYGTTPYTPAVTTTTANTMVVRFIANSTTSFPEPAGTTLRWRFPASGTTATGVTASDESFVGPGTSPERDSVAQSTTSSHGVGQTVALRRAPGTPSAVLKWTSTPSSWAAGYKGDRTAAGTSPVSHVVPSVTVTTITDPSVVNGRTYTYRVWAYRGAWVSDKETVTLPVSC